MFSVAKMLEHKM